MTAALITAGATVIVGLLSFAGVAVTNRKANDKMQTETNTAMAVMNEKLQELTREVRLHNNFAQRIPIAEEQIKVINHRIKDLEQYHK